MLRELRRVVTGLTCACSRIVTCVSGVFFWGEKTTDREDCFLLGPMNSGLNSRNLKLAETEAPGGPVARRGRVSYATTDASSSH